MTETIIYGGSFNPPTRAHQAILEACQEIGETWIMPSGERADKTIAMPVEHRLGMIAAMTSSKVERLEIDSVAQTETCTTVANLSERYPDHTFRYVFGSDAYQSMQTWRGGEVMKQTLPMLIVPRPGYPATQLGSNAQLLNVDTKITSSTQVRERIMADEDIDDLVCPAVASYLKKHHLYLK